MQMRDECAEELGSLPRRARFYRLFLVGNVLLIVAHCDRGTADVSRQWVMLLQFVEFCL